MTDRFDLEQRIMKCWNITEDVQLLRKQLSDKEMSKDDIANYLQGLESIYEVKFNALWDCFEELVGQRKIT